ncbi:MAG: hypothetical protein AVDCRST_MAG64-69, partial [uncultured Phycisphaerae bacterium]
GDDRKHRAVRLGAVRADGVRRPVAAAGCHLRVRRRVAVPADAPDQVPRHPRPGQDHRLVVRHPDRGLAVRRPHAHAVPPEVVRPADGALVRQPVRHQPGERAGRVRRGVEHHRPARRLGHPVLRRPRLLQRPRGVQGAGARDRHRGDRLPPDVLRRDGDQPDPAPEALRVRAALAGPVQALGRVPPDGVHAERAGPGHVHDVRHPAGRVDVDERDRQTAVRRADAGRRRRPVLHPDRGLQDDGRDRVHVPRDGRPVLDQADAEHARAGRRAADPRAVRHPAGVHVPAVRRDARRRGGGGGGRDGRQRGPAPVAHHPAQGRGRRRRQGVRRPQPVVGLGQVGPEHARHHPVAGVHRVDAGRGGRARVPLLQGHGPDGRALDHHHRAVRDRRARAADADDHGPGPDPVGPHPAAVLGPPGRRPGGGHGGPARAAHDRQPAERDDQPAVHAGARRGQRDRPGRPANPPPVRPGGRRGRARPAGRGEAGRAGLRGVPGAAARPATPGRQARISGGRPAGRLPVHGRVPGDRRPATRRPGRPAGRTPPPAETI